MRTFAIPLCLVILIQGCASLGPAPEPMGPNLTPLYQTVPLFENSLPQCRFEVIEPIRAEGPLDSPRVVEQVTARAMFLGGDALILLPTFDPLAEGPQGRNTRCSLAVIKFRKWTCKH